MLRNIVCPILPRSTSINSCYNLIQEYKNNQRLHMLKEVILHTKSFSAISRRTVKWKISALYLCHRSDVFGRREGEHRSLCHVLFLQCMWPWSVYVTFYLLCKTFCVGNMSWAAFPLSPGSKLSFHSLLGRFFFLFAKCFMFHSLALPFPLVFLLNVKHVQIWIYSVAKLYDSGHFSKAEKTHTTYTSCV